jgi:hypothetical protein
MSSHNGNGAPDKLDAAIAVAKQPPQKLRQWAAQIASTGRQAAILLPPDATDGEIAEFCGWVLGPVLATYRAERASPRPRIERVAAMPSGLSNRKD